MEKYQFMAAANNEIIRLYLSEQSIAQKML